MRNEVIVAENLTKIFRTKERKGFLKRGKVKEIVAVDHISFKVYRGEVFGFLGPNGAGKTTTVKLLTTLLLPDEGEAWVNGYHVVKEAGKVRETIGVSLYSDRGFYWKLTGRENLRYYAYLHHIPPKEAEKRIEKLLKLVELDKDADRLVEEYSTGMKSRLNIARALLNEPETLFLDEPTIGLDPASARRIREIVRSFADDGGTVFLTTHNMEEADQLCDRIAIINKGKIVALGTPGELKEMVQGKQVLEVEAVGVKNGLAARLQDKVDVSYATVTIVDPAALKARIRIGFDGRNEAALPAVLEVLVREGVKVQHIRLLEPSLEDVFITLTGKSFHEEENS